MPRSPVATLRAVDRIDTGERASKIVASPFVWRDAASIPLRQWIFGSSLLRGSVSFIIAPGAAGKTALTAGMALSLVTGREFLGKRVHGGPKRVWLWNLEDSRDEITRLLMAATLYWQVKPDDLDERLFLDSGLDGAELCLATEGSNGFQINTSVVVTLANELKRQQIDVLIVDPFVSSHRVSENENGAIDAISKTWACIAVEANCAILIVHHTRKSNGQENTADSARGASALVNAGRSVLTLNRMTENEAKRLGIEPDERRQFFRVYDDKNNRAPPADKSDWYRLESQSLGNGPNGGDSLPVVTPWAPPEAFDGVSLDHLRRVQTVIAGGEWRQSEQCSNWAGKAVAEVLDLDLSRKADKARAKSILKTWLDNEALVIEQRKDSERKLRPFVAVGKWADDNSAPPLKSTVAQGVAVAQRKCATTTPFIGGGGVVVAR